MQYGREETYRSPSLPIGGNSLVSGRLKMAIRTGPWNNTTRWCMATKGLMLNVDIKSTDGQRQSVDNAVLAPARCAYSLDRYLALSRVPQMQQGNLI